MGTRQHSTKALGDRSMRKDQKGIALFTVMAAVVVVMMMLGAFLTSHQSQLALNATSRERQACRDALDSVAQFCRFRLEDDSAWLRVTTSNFSQQTYSDPNGQPIFLFQEVDPNQFSSRPELARLGGRTILEGRVVASGVDFRVSVVNNLAFKTADSIHQVPAESCRLRIQALYGRTSESAEIVLRNAAYFSSTVAASGDIEVEADSVTFASSDPLRNQIRSLSDIKLPDTPDLQFQPDAANQRAEKGTVWAYGDIEIDQDSSNQKLLQATTQTGGEFIPDARTAYSVPELNKRDVGGDLAFRIANGQAPNALELAPARYVFCEADVEFKDTDGMDRTKTIKTLFQSTPGNLPQNDTFDAFHFMESDLLDPNTPYTPDPTTVALVNGPNGGPAFGTPHPPDPNGDPIFQLTNGPQVQLGGGGALVLPADREILVRGDFSVGTDDPTNLPTLTFYDPDPLLPDPNNPDRGHLEVERDLGLAAYVSNGGKLIAGRDVAISPKEIEVNANETEDLAIYAGQDVTIQPLFVTNQGYLDDRNKKYVFRGLVYAQNDFNFLSSIDRNGTTVDYNRKLEVEGALVARNGAVKIQGNEDIMLRYNPDFLDDLLEKNFQETHSQVEEISWRPL